MSGFRHKLVQAAQDQRGGVAIIFGLALLPLILLTGAAVDYSRASALQTRLQGGADGALLNLCKQSSATTPDQLQQIAKASLAGYMEGAAATVDPILVTANPRSITLTAHAVYDTIFVNILRIPSVPITATATCQSGERSLEIALVLDNTGSMAESSGATSKMDALKQAATDFVNFVYNDPSLSTHTRMALVPFAAAVAVDPAAYRNATWIDQNAQSKYHWQNFSGAPAANLANRLAVFSALKAAKANWDWAGCFESLPYPLNVQDGRPSPANPDSYYVPMLAPDEAGNGGEPVHFDPGSGSFQAPSNSYIDDATSAPGCSGTFTDSDRTRMTRACKYLHPQNAQSLSLVGQPIGPNMMCTTLPLTRLTNNQRTLLTQIALMRAGGNTDIHEGLIWGWRTISPDSVFGDGASYTQASTTKILVLMTDGFNTWTSNPLNSILHSFYSAYGYYTNADGTNPNGRLPPANANPLSNDQARAAMDALTLETCQNAAKAGVMIYTIGFSVPADPIDAKGLALLKSCAGASDRAIVANDANALIAAFKKIGQDMTNLRLAR